MYEISSLSIVVSTLACRAGDAGPIPAAGGCIMVRYPRREPFQEETIDRRAL